VVRELIPLELETLSRIAEAEAVLYQFPTKRHKYSHRTVLLINPATNNPSIVHLNVAVVDVLRLEGYICVLDKNADRYSRIGLTDKGRLLVGSIR
jgi:hypothetical protein